MKTINRMPTSIMPDQSVIPRHKPTFGAKCNLAGADIFRKHFLSTVPASLQIPRQKIAGYKFILTEAEGIIPKEEALKYASQYADFVVSIASKLKKQGITSTDEKGFIDAMLKTKQELNLSPDHFNFIYESMREGKFDSYSFLLLTFDVGKALGIDVQMVFAEKDLIATKSYFLETTSGRYLSIGELTEHWSPSLITSDMEIICWQAYNNRGIYFVLPSSERASLHNAIANLTKALELNPNSAHAYFNRGLAYYTLGCSHDSSEYYEQAVQDISTAITLIPKEADSFIYSTMGDVHTALKQFPEAIQAFTRAIKRASIDKLHLYYSMRGNAHFSSGKYEAAIQDYQRAIDSNPAVLAAYMDGETWCVNNRGDGLILHAHPPERHITRTQFDADCFNDIGAAHLKLGNISNATHYFEEALKIIPDHPTFEEALKIIPDNSAAKRNLAPIS